MENVKKNEAYWDDFYKKLSLQIPSQFCVMMATEIPEDSAIVELGCGNGRDALYLSSLGNSVIGLDLSNEAVDRCQKIANAKKYLNTKFVQGSLADRSGIQKAFEIARGINPKEPTIVYSRFVMHSIDDVQEKAFIELLAGEMQTDEKVYFEFRSKGDSGTKKIYENHYRRFVDTDKFIKTFCDQYNFELLYSLTGKGMAKYKQEDPVVSRLILKKK